MKIKSSIQLLSLFIFLSWFSVGCEKIVKPSNEAKEIFGKWEFIYDTGGFFGGGGSNRFPEKCWVKFSRAGNFNVYEGAKLISTTRFMLTMKKDYKGDFIPAIVTNIEFDRYETFRIEGDRLYLREQGTDSFTYCFERK